MQAINVDELPDMHVLLVFREFSLKRAYLKGISEYTFIDKNKHERPMIQVEYTQKLAELGLNNIREFV
jgi:hypothetical protein